MPAGAESAFFFGALIGTALGIGLSGIVWAVFGDRTRLPLPLPSRPVLDAPAIPDEGAGDIRPSLDLIALHPRPYPLEFPARPRWPR